MKYLKQFLIILAISMIGEILKYLLPLPVPASIYGMLILFVGLMTGIIRLESVREAGVGLMASWGVLKPVLVPVSIITVVCVFTVMGVSGVVTQFLIKIKKNR